ncbi:uncharacterized protein [Pseudorasbora parva]|uniref:uncharacterized protein isoform X2 n=1 Tax=Pseudorasbora parva TaxID=51549 RepID=UPI00351E5D3E
MTKDLSSVTSHWHCLHVRLATSLGQAAKGSRQNNCRPSLTSQSTTIQHLPVFSQPIKFSLAGHGQYSVHTLGYALGLTIKYLKLCSEDERRSYRCGTTLGRYSTFKAIRSALIAETLLELPEVKGCAKGQGRKSKTGIVISLCLQGHTCLEQKLQPLCQQSRSIKGSREPRTPCHSKKQRQLSPRSEQVLRDRSESAGTAVLFLSGTEPDPLRVKTDGQNHGKTRRIMQLQHPAPINMTATSHIRVSASDQGNKGRAGPRMRGPNYP